MLEADCARCQGLCCVALAFDRGEWFSFDKRSNEPCRHLLPTNRCAVHDSLAARGLGGCARYECYGAGQRVCEELFSGRSWRDDPEIAPAMLAAFRKLKDIHELSVLLRAARALELPAPKAARRAQLLARLEPASGWSIESLADCDTQALGDEVHAFLRSLREHVGQKRRIEPKFPAPGEPDCPRTGFVAARSSCLPSCCSCSTTSRRSSTTSRSWPRSRPRRLPVF